MDTTSNAGHARYTATAIRLHWLIAILITATFSVGLFMHELPLSPQKLKIYAWHKWAGVSVLLLAAARLAWRARHRPPPLPAAMPTWQRRLAAALHHLLYLLMFAIPLSGWLMSSAKGFQTVYFGVLPLPDLVAKNAQLGDVLQRLHQFINFAMAALVGAHAAAAIKHHFVDRDDVLVRMLPFLKPTR